MNWSRLLLAYAFLFVVLVGGVEGQRRRGEDKPKRPGFCDFAPNSHIKAALKASGEC